MESFAYRYLDRKRLASFYRCRRRDRRGVRFFKWSFLGLVLYAVNTGKERLVDLDRENRSADATVAVMPVAMEPIAAVFKKVRLSIVRPPLDAVA